jgi:hypothetical protein
MVRKHVQKAVGRVRVVLHRPVTVSIIRGELFKALDGQLYATDVNAVFKAADTPLTKHNESHLVPFGDKFAFSVPVTAHDSGTATPRTGDAFEVLIAPPGLVRAFAEKDFRGSFVLQDDADVLRCLKMGMTAQGFSGRANIEAMIWKADPAQYRFPADIQTVKIIGAGDEGGKPGHIRILVGCRPGVDVANLLSELREYLHEPSRACLGATVTVETL